MPATNPFFDPGANLEAIDGSPVIFTAGIPTVRQAVAPAAAQAGIAGRLEGWALNPTGAASSTNAAGTAENVALHVALIVAAAMIGVYVLRASGFRFVAAGGLG